MNLIHKIDSFEVNNVFFQEKKKNIIMDGTFTKLLYSMPNISILGLFFDFTINGKIINNKLYAFNVNENNNTINELVNIEKKLLKMYTTIYNIDKRVVSILKNNLFQGLLKVFTKREIVKKKYVLKISGIWETSSEIGITYKLLECTHL